MNAAGIKNVILMTLLILILHFMIKNFFLERQTTKEVGGENRDCKIACATTTETACRIACETKPQDESHHDALKKFVFEAGEEDVLPPPPPPPSHPQPPSPTADATNRSGAFEWIDDGSASSSSTDGGLAGFCADSDRCGFSFL